MKATKEIKHIQRPSRFQREVKDHEMRASTFMAKRASAASTITASVHSQHSSVPTEVFMQQSRKSVKSRESIKLFSNLYGLELDMDEFVDTDDQTQDPVELDPEFESIFLPEEMRCLALVAHNHMKPAMKDFVLANKNVLKKFMLTGTNSTMTMLKQVFGGDPAVVYGPTCTSGPLGGDAELVALMVTENLGGCIFFTDPMSSHPHQADVGCLNRQANVHNILVCPNPTTAQIVMPTFRTALKSGHSEMIPSFFETLSSPSVLEYKKMQELVIKQNM